MAKVHVSDHALLRYIERALEIPVDKLREQIEAKARPAATMGATMFNFDNIKFCLTRPDDNGNVTVKTVMERWMKMDNKGTKNNRLRERKP